MRGIDDLPVRQLMRLHTEMTLASAKRSMILFPGRPMLAIEFGVVARICLPDWTPGGALAVPEAATQAITVRRIALSLGVPPETTRRRVRMLIDAGAFVASADGVSLAVTPENAAFAIRYYQGVHDMLVRYIEDLHRTSDIDIKVAAVPVFTAQDVIERSIDILLRAVDTALPKTIDRAAYFLWGALTAVAVRTVTHDPVLSRLYGNSIPPDDIRQGISLRRLAAALSLTYPTAWRYMEALQAAGLVTRLGHDRWTVSYRNLLNTVVREVGEPAAIFPLRQTRELALLGLDPADAGRHYLAGRQSIADFG